MYGSYEFVSKKNDVLNILSNFFILFHVKLLFIYVSPNGQNRRLKNIPRTVSRFGIFLDKKNTNKQKVGEITKIAIFEGKETESRKKSQGQNECFIEIQFFFSFSFFEI